jgi:hypothetical protein
MAQWGQWQVLWWALVSSLTSLAGQWCVCVSARNLGHLVTLLANHGCFTCLLLLFKTTQDTAVYIHTQLVGTSTSLCVHVRCP